MARIGFFILMLLSSGAFSENGLTKTVDNSVDQVNQTIDEISQNYEQCEALYEHIRQSECAKGLFGFFGRIYLKLGMSFTERQLKFQNIATEKDAFILSSGLKPRPIYSISLNDAYFHKSNWGYGFGFSFFDDFAFEQIIKRGSGDSNKVTVDLGTYSSMAVIAVSPSMFYSWGRDDDTPNRYGKFGLGLNLMYSAVRGTAYLTELEDDTVCFNAGSDLVAGNGSKDVVRAACSSTRFRETSYGSGVKLFIAGEWNKWESELAISVFNHRGNGEYRYVTQETLISLSRKFAF